MASAASKAPKGLIGANVPSHLCNVGWAIAHCCGVMQ